MRLFELYERKIFIFSALLVCNLIFQSCVKEYSLENANSTTDLATGTLKDSLNNCLFNSVHGNYYKGIAAQTDSNFLELGVNVTHTGYYSITTDLQNGFKFADSGFFTTTGIHTILLKAVGKPISADTSTFSVGFDSSLCSFSVNVLDSTVTTGGGDTTGGSPVDPDTLTDNSWIFTANGHTYFGPITTAQLGQINVIYGGGWELYISGPTQSSQDTAFILTVKFSGNISIGTYNTFAEATAFNLGKTTGNNDPIYLSDYLNTRQVVTIEITKYDEATKTVTGVFSGNSRDINDNRVPITNGAFKATIQ